MRLATASPILAGAVPGCRLARFSQAVSMMLELVLHVVLPKFETSCQNAVCARRHSASGGDERDAHEPCLGRWLTPLASRARKLPAETTTLYSASSRRANSVSGSASRPRGRNWRRACRLQYRGDERRHLCEFSAYRRRLSMTCASSFQAATEAVCTAGFIARRGRCDRAETA